MLSKQDVLLLTAAKQGSLHAVAKALVFGANVDVQDDKGNTALHWAVFHKKQNLIRLLLGCGALLKKNKEFETPLQWASSQSVDCFIYLLSERTLYMPASHLNQRNYNIFKKSFDSQKSNPNSCLYH
jgi:ankyrin repeat protein